MGDGPDWLIKALEIVEELCLRGYALPRRSGHPQPDGEAARRGVRWFACWQDVPMAIEVMENYDLRVVRFDPEDCETELNSVCGSVYDMDVSRTADLFENLQDDEDDEDKADDLDLDGTDFADPAWWRGNDQGVAMVVTMLEKLLDGEDDGAGVVGYEPLERLRRRLLALHRAPVADDSILVAIRASARGS
jgi:hypothetical protein